MKTEPPEASRVAPPGPMVKPRSVLPRLAPLPRYWSVPPLSTRLEAPKPNWPRPPLAPLVSPWDQPATTSRPLFTVTTWLP